MGGFPDNVHVVTAFFFSLHTSETFKNDKNPILKLAKERN